MDIDSLKKNLVHMKEITKELYFFVRQLFVIKNLEEKFVINREEKKLLTETVNSLIEQLKIINDSNKKITNNIVFMKLKEEQPIRSSEGLVKLEFVPKGSEEKVSLVISSDKKKDFVRNFSKSTVNKNKLEEKFSVQEEKEKIKVNYYAKISNLFFRGLSSRLSQKSYFVSLNRDLRMIDSPFILSTYISIILFSVFLAFLLSIVFFVLLLFFDFSLTFPFLKEVPSNQTILMRVFNYFWILFVFPVVCGILLYLYPSSEAKNLGKKIDQELPFVVIHMSAIATSGIEPLNIFNIMLKNKEYGYSNIQFRKLLNLINFHGEDLVSALKKISATCPSKKMKVLLNGITTSITFGGDIHEYLDKHAESLLFDYKLEREKYTKISETFMNIYISVAIAAPMIFLILFIIIGSTGSFMSYFGISLEVLSILIISIIIFINVLFLVFLRLNQPKM